MIAYTVEQIAQQWHTTPKVVQGLIDAGKLRARRDGMISGRTLNAYIRRQYRLTQIYLDKRRAGMSAKQAHREVWGAGTKGGRHV
jgi:hypothetical protein